MITDAPISLFDTEDALFIERRNVYGCGTVVLTASISNGVALLEQYPECVTTSAAMHVLIPVTSVVAIERLEAFLAEAKGYLREVEERQRQQH